MMVPSAGPPVTDLFGMAISNEPWPGQLTSIQKQDLRWEANHHGKIANRNLSPPRVVLPRDKTHRLPVAHVLRRRGPGPIPAGRPTRFPSQRVMGGDSG
jgi:hypothetical protein